MNMRDFMNEYASDLMTMFPEQMDILITKNEYKSSIRDENVALLPHPFAKGKQSCVIKDRNGTSIHKLSDWQNDPALRLQVVTGEHYDPNHVWKETLRFFLEHEKFGRGFSTWAWDMGTNFRKGKVSVCCPPLTPDLQEQLTAALAKKGYHCMFVDMGRSSYLHWEARKQVNFQQVSEFIQECKNVVSEIMPYQPKQSFFQRVLSFFER